MKLFMMLLVVLSLGNLNAKEVSIDQVKVAYVYNFLKHTDWQDEFSLKEYHLLVVSDNQTLKNMFSMLSSRKRLNDKKIRVSFYNEAKSPSNIQAIYVDSQNAPLYDRLFDAYDSDDVLFVSDGYNNPQKVMINLVHDGNIVTFEINKANILNRSLQISPDLILLGGTEIDVAKLYRSSQSELKAQKETITELTGKISEKNRELADKISAIKQQKAELDEQKGKIEFQKSIITQQLESINAQNDKIRLQQQELGTIRQNIEEQKKMLAVEEQKIEDNELILQQLLASHSHKHLEIQSASDRLKRLNDQIEKQKDKLLQKEGVISTQKGTIVALSILVGIIVLLVLYVFKQNALLKHLSHTDVLTGLFNRRAFLDRLDDEIFKYNRYGTPLSILLMDVDHFKAINDTYGHDKGDEVLKHFASLMGQHTRMSDICVRWGGEEFLIMATNTDLESALRLAQNFRQIVEESDFGLEQRITVSIGIAAMREDLDTESLIKTADKALYEAKQNGRNCIVC